MKKKALIIVFSLIIVGIVGYVLYVFACWYVFAHLGEPKTIVQTEINSRYALEIRHIPSTALGEDYIQVRQHDKENKEEQIIGNYKGYNFLNGYEIKNDSLMLIVSRTFEDQCYKIDTVSLKIK